VTGTSKEGLATFQDIKDKDSKDVKPADLITYVMSQVEAMCGDDIAMIGGHPLPHLLRLECILVFVCMFRFNAVSCADILQYVMSPEAALFKPLLDEHAMRECTSAAEDAKRSIDAIGSGTGKTTNCSPLLMGFICERIRLTNAALTAWEQRHIIGMAIGSASPGQMVDIHIRGRV
jgi:hypothetical protein